MPYQKSDKFPLLVKPVINLSSNFLDYYLGKKNKWTVAYSLTFKHEYYHNWTTDPLLGGI